MGHGTTWRLGRLPTGSTTSAWCEKQRHGTCSADLPCEHSVGAAVNCGECGTERACARGMCEPRSRVSGESRLPHGMWRWPSRARSTGDRGRRRSAGCRDLEKHGNGPRPGEGSVNASSNGQNGLCSCTRERGEILPGRGEVAPSHGAFARSPRTPSCTGEDARERWRIDSQAQPQNGIRRFLLPRRFSSTAAPAAGVGKCPSSLPHSLGGYSSCWDSSCIALRYSELIDTCSLTQHVTAHYWGAQRAWYLLTALRYAATRPPPRSGEGCRAGR
jgi:hypothetical protein